MFPVYLKKVCFLSSLGAVVYLLSTYYMSSIILNAFHILMHVIPWQPYVIGYSYYPHFTDEVTELVDGQQSWVSNLAMCFRVFIFNSYALMPAQVWSLPPDSCKSPGALSSLVDSFSYLPTCAVFCSAQQWPRHKIQLLPWIFTKLHSPKAARVPHALCWWGEDLLGAGVKTGGVYPEELQI